MDKRADVVKASGLRTWLPELLFAVPIVAGTVGLFCNWYAVRDRYFIFLYYHDMGARFDTSPFGWVTAGRYRISALVASGAVMVPYLALNLVLGRAIKGYRAPVWWRVWILCALPLLIAVPAIVMTVNDPVLPLALAAQVTAVTLVGLALAVWMGQLAAERPLAYGLTLIDGGALASLLVSLILFEQYPRLLAHGSTGYIYVHLVVVAAGIGLLLAMTAVYTLWRRAQTPGALITLVAGLEIGYLFVPLCHFLFFCKDGGSWRDADYFSYVTSADNYFARNAYIQIGVWLAVALIAVGFSRLRVWLAGRRKGGNDANSV